MKHNNLRKISSDEKKRHPNMEYVMEFHQGDDRYFTLGAIQELYEGMRELLPSPPPVSKGAKEKREELSDYLKNEHDLICLESELDLIINIIESFANQQSAISKEAKEVLKEDGFLGMLNQILIHMVDEPDKEKRFEIHRDCWDQIAEGYANQPLAKGMSDEDADTAIMYMEDLGIFTDVKVECDKGDIHLYDLLSTYLKSHQAPEPRELPTNANIENWLIGICDPKDLNRDGDLNDMLWTNHVLKYLQAMQSNPIQSEGDAEFINTHLKNIKRLEIEYEIASRTCKGCKFWDNESSKHSGESGIKSEGMCKNKEVRVKIGFDQGDNITYNENFGCIHFKAISKKSSNND